MSSPRLNAVLGSSVFRRTLLITLGVMVLAAVLIGLVAWVLIARVEADQRARITAAAERADALFAAEGVSGLIGYFAPDGVRVRPPRDLVIAKDEDELIGVLRDSEFNALAGFSGLYAEPDWGAAELDYPIVDGAVLAYRFEIGAMQATLALFVPEHVARIRDLALTGALTLAVIALPLGVVLGLMLGVFVVHRLRGLAETVEGVAAGRIDKRVPVNGSGDEFERLSVSVNAMLDRLEALNRNIEQVSVGVAHDLKTPLGNIGGRLQLMARDIGDRDAVARHIGVAETHLQTLLRTFDALLRLGEVESGARRKGFARVDLSVVLADLAQSYAPVFADADKTLAIHIAPALAIRGDEALLIQMATNLLENVIEHARDGARAWIALDRRSGALVLEVGDDGPGIPEAEPARLFDRFYRGDPSRSAPGNGLGLSLVKAIADLHGASLDIDPDAEGMVLTVSFPTMGEDYNSV